VLAKNLPQRFRSKVSLRADIARFVDQNAHLGAREQEPLSPFEGGNGRPKRNRMWRSLAIHAEIEATALEREPIKIGEMTLVIGEEA
jgi:hypothetical protein